MIYYKLHYIERQKQTDRQTDRQRALVIFHEVLGVKCFEMIIQLKGYTGTLRIIDVAKAKQNLYAAS